MKNSHKKVLGVLFALIILIASIKIVNADIEMLDKSPNIFGALKQTSQSGDSGSEEDTEGLGDSEEIIEELEEIEELDSTNEEALLGASVSPFATRSQVVVSTFAEFKTAVDAGATNILITNGFTFAVNVHIPGDITIDGGGNVISEGHLFNLNAGGVNSTVTIKNMTIQGYTNYGFVTTARSGGTGAKIIYDNVNYTGPQLGYFRKNNTLIIKDSTINIGSNGTPSQEVQELAEVTRLELIGKVNISKSIGPASVYSLVWFIFSSSQKATFLVHEGADVTIINEKSYFYYYPDTQGLDFIVEDNTKLIMNMATGWSYNIAHYLDNFHVGENSTVLMTHTNEKYGYLNNVVNQGGPEGGAFTVKSTFYIGKNTVFSIENAHKTHLSPIYLSANNVNFHIEEPKMLYIQGHITGAAVNQRNNVYLVADTINVWRKGETNHSGNPTLPSGESGILSGARVDGVKEAIAVVNFDEEMNFFKKGAYAGIIMGKSNLVLDHNPQDTDFTIDGTVDAENDMVEAFYVPRGTSSEISDSAIGGAGGRFSIAMRGGTPQGKGPLVKDDLIVFDTITKQPQFVGNPALHGRDAYLVEGVSAGVKLVAVPDIKFGTLKIPPTSTIFPTIEGTKVVVEDDTDNTSWSVSVKSTKLSELSSGGSQVIDEDAIGYMKNNIFNSLKDPVTIWASSSNPSNITQELAWEPNDLTEGIVLKLTPDNVKTGDYSSLLTWTIEITP